MRNLLLIAFQLTSICCLAQSGDSLVARLERVFLKESKPGLPGCACAIAENNNIIYEKAFGWANIEQRIPVTTNTIMGIGSVSKHFTAYAMLLLQKEGKLSLNDPVTNYVDLPYLRDTIRLYHLLTHTAGFHECTNFFDILYGNPDRMRTMTRIDELIRNHWQLEFSPGTQYSYNNTGYSLAAFIIEKVSGQGFPEFLSKKIFQPLKMNSTNVKTRHEVIPPEQAIPYKMGSASEILIDSLKHDFYGFTGVFTSVSDFLKWNEHIAELEKKNDPLYTQLTALRRLQNGKSLNYGYGFDITTYNGHKLIAHSGRDNGYTSYYLRFPQKKLSLIMICNNRYAVPWITCYRMADQLLSMPDKKQARLETSTANKISSYQLNNLQNYTGLFWSPQKRFDRDAVVRIEHQDNDLYLFFSGRKRQLIPVSANKLQPVNSEEQWTVVFNHLKRIDRIIITTNRDTSAIYYQVEVFDDMKAKQLEGKYRSEELGITVTVRKENDRWVMDHPEMGALNLLPVFDKGFNSKVGLLVWEGGNNERFRLFYESISRLYFYRSD